MGTMKTLALWLLGGLIVLAPAVGVSATHSRLTARDTRTVTAPPAVQLAPVLSGLTKPLYVIGAKDGTNRLFIVEQGGLIKVLQPGAASPTIFLDLTSRVL